MKRLFADANYWIALINKRDEIHRVARAVEEELALGTQVVTTEMVLAEFLNIVAIKCTPLKPQAASFVQHLRARTDIQIVAQTAELFARAFDVYRNFRDKPWGLTDCASRDIMNEFEITDALTYDKHFVQMGFNALLRQHKKS